MIHMPVIAHEMVRGQFPALTSGFGFFENAGGSQVPQCVIDAVAKFMTDSYAQIGFPYEHSARSTQVVKDAHQFYNVLFNGEGLGETAIGPSTTALVHMLSGSVARSLKPGDEIIISIANHEANSSPWMLLERMGAVVKTWGIDPETGASSLDELRGLLSERTRIVAFPVTSNLLGDTMPVREIADLVHAFGGRVVVDAVAYASHLAMDVQAWDADFCVFSNYKVYGPHIAGMWGKREAWLELEGPNHFFIPRDQIPSKFELGCLSYEALAGVLALGDYMKFITGETEVNRHTVERAFAQFKLMEAHPLKILLDFLAGRDDVRVLGSPRPSSDRHPTISFVHKNKRSDVISVYVNARGFGIRHGHAYSLRLCEAMGVPGDPGVVRVSAVHYNSPQETVELTRILAEAMD